MCRRGTLKRADWPRLLAWLPIPLRLALIAGLWVADLRTVYESRTAMVPLKEIHHRVKNNMQAMSSLVALQAERLPDAATRAVLQDVIHRVRSMALAHEKLYQSADMAQVEFAEYSQSLLNYLWRAHGTTAPGIRLALDLVQMLAGQLHAAVDVCSNEGSAFTVTFGGPKTMENGKA